MVLTNFVKCIVRARLIVDGERDMCVVCALRIDSDPGDVASRFALEQIFQWHEFLVFVLGYGIRRTTGKQDWIIIFKMVGLNF